MIRFAKPKDKSNFLSCCTKFNSDFYVLENGKKIYLTDLKTASKVFNSCIKHGNKCIVYESNGEILGLALILIDKNTKERYFKLLVDNPKTGELLLQYMVWHIKNEFTLIIKRSNFLYRTCNERKYKFDDRKNFGFKFVRTYNRTFFYKYIPNLIREKEYTKEEN